FLAVLFIVLQGLLGAGAVVFGQSKVVLALHFGISAMSFASVVILTLLAFENGRSFQTVTSISKSYKSYFLFVIVYCYAVIYSGAYVKHKDATLSCSGFPLCNGELFPGFTG